ncbi:hypothetical protein B0H16DRAFT_1561086 [Mycena metata]|uniref:F-box domain-containing protein n=1 Tax=Mycena metata TaxID=1033252 RepID=A0AAD7IJD7_9AGAR|nr:hypothetical protein B0H16DRAFT_1561086 [Mycena metata]
MQGARYLGQSPQIPSQGRPTSGAAASPATRITLNDVYALVKSMEGRMAVHDRKIQTQEHQIWALKRDNAELWQEIHRLKGPRFPFEIFSSIILSIGDKKTLKMCSLVSRGWMSVTRKVLFTRIRHDAMFWMVKIKPLPILQNVYCTVYPYVRTIEINGSLDDGSGAPAYPGPWLDNFLKLIPKFVALRTLNLYALGEYDVKAVQRSLLSHSMVDNITELTIDSDWDTMSEFTTSISQFTALKKLTPSLEGPTREVWPEISESAQSLIAPPSSLRALSFSNTDGSSPFAPTVLRWFVDCHSGTIDSIDPHDLPFEHPVDFRKFLTRFGSTLSEIKFSISGREGAEKFLRSDYCAAMPHLKSLQLDFWGHIFSYSYFDKSFLSKIELLPKILALVPPSIEELILSMEPNVLDPRKTATSQQHTLSPGATQHRLGSIKWSRLDQLLTGSRYPSLRTLKLVMPHCYYAEGIDEEMKQMWANLLPLCVGRGILETEIRP